MMTRSDLCNRQNYLILGIKFISIAKSKISIINKGIEPFIISVSSANNLIKSLFNNIEEITTMLTICSLKITLGRILGYTKNLLAYGTKLIFSIVLRYFNTIFVKNLISHCEIKHKILYRRIISVHFIEHTHNMIRKCKLSHLIFPPFF